MKFLKLRKTELEKVSDLPKPDIICKECGNEILRDNGLVNIGGFEFGAYQCMKCGNEVFIDHDKAYVKQEDYGRILNNKEQKRLI